ncbi:hypothetical protein B0H10DRAFT_2219880 [Mycena sp. CBHHK59/15]|nr:hypothetical protein B0H10DRAFT_2219880 [Mycena sp. CBHHK59/15]
MQQTTISLIIDEEEERQRVDAGEDLFLASPTLTRFNAADVSLDMDVRDWSLDSDDEESEYEESGDDSDDLHDLN